MSGDTLLFSEVLDKVHKAKTKDQKVRLLREHNTPALRSILKASFDPKIQWDLPNGNVPYAKNDAPAGTEHTRLDQEADKLYRFVKGGQDSLQSMKRETLFVQMLEGLHADEAKLLINIKDKKLHQVYKGLSSAVVKEGLGLDDDYKVV